MAFEELRCAVVLFMVFSHVCMTEQQLSSDELFFYLSLFSLLVSNFTLALAKNQMN